MVDVLGSPLWMKPHKMAAQKPACGMMTEATPRMQRASKCKTALMRMVCRSLIAVGICGLLLGAVAAQQAPPATQQFPAQELVRRAIANEEKASQQHLRLLYRLRTEKPKAGAITKELVETNEGVVARLIAVNDKPPSAEQRQVDDERLQKLASDPQARTAKRKQQKEDEERTSRMVKALPDAFLYEYDGFEPDKNGQQLIRLKFKPNPKYEAPNRELQVYYGMEGSMLIDPAEERLVKIQAHLFKGVNFGWGILGHLDPGGQFEAEQSRVGGDRWEVANMRLRFTGKILLFKSLNIDEHETAFDYRRAGRFESRPGDRIAQEAAGIPGRAEEPAAIAPGHLAGGHTNPIPKYVWRRSMLRPYRNYSCNVDCSLSGERSRRSTE